MLSIGQLASATGVATSAVRYYERQGLLAPSTRSEANYRLYGLDAIAALRFIKSAKEAGFTLRDIRKLLSVRDGSPADCEEVETLLEKRLQIVNRELETFSSLRQRLVTLQRLCRQTDNGKECRAIRRLSVPSSSGKSF